MNRPAHEFDCSATPALSGARFVSLPAPVARCLFVLALLIASDRLAAAPARKASSKPVTPLECVTLQLSETAMALPALDASATLTLRNVSASPAVIVKPALGFFSEFAKNKWRDVTTSIYVEPDAANPWFVAPGQTAQLKFKVQFLHDAPAGKIRVAPRIEYFSQADNAFPQLVDFGKTAGAWRVDEPAEKFNATATRVQGASTPPGAQSAVQLAVRDNRLKGRITLQSPRSTLRPNTDYVAGVLYKSDRSGWDSPINKGAAIVEYADQGAVRAQPLHLFEVPYWSWELARFKSTPQSARASMEVWNRGWELGQKGQSWYGAAFLVPAAKLRVLDVVAVQPVVSVTASTAPNIAFLGDDRPKAGEGGDWIGRYGNESFILCGMQSPQDVVGGRFLPRRRWTKGKDGFAPTAPVWTDWKGEFFYEVLTGDPKEPPRHWIPIDELTTDDSRALINPLEGGRRYSSWDDRGEIHPFDGKGPDLIVNLEIPQGLHRLTLYFIDWDFWNTERPRAHRLFFSDGNKDEKAGLLGSGYVSDFGQGVYKVYGVSGPSKLRLRIQKDKSVCAVLSGILLDEINLPDAKRVLPQSEQSAALRQAAQEWETLRRLQSTPGQLLAAGERMKNVLRLADQVVKSGTPKEQAAAAWLRWQAASTLVVAPAVRPAAFQAYLAARGPLTTSQAKTLCERLLAENRIGEARQVAAIWLELARLRDRRLGAGPRRLPLSQRESLWTLIEAFAGRDAEFAAQLATRWVALLQTQGEDASAALRQTEHLHQEAQKESAAPWRRRVLFRIVTALYNAVERAYGATKLGEEGAFRRAQAFSRSPGYRSSATKRAVTAYREYLARWPRGRHVQEAQLSLVALGCGLARPSEPQARRYVALGEWAAHALLARAVSPAHTAAKESARPHLSETSLSPSAPRPENAAALLSPQAAALSAARQMATYYSRIKDTAAAKVWMQTIARHSPAGDWTPRPCLDCEEQS